MKNIKLIGLVLIILSLQIANAHEEEVPAGVTPDSFLWGLDKALDNLNLLLTFDKGEKARKGMEIARERLEEIKLMAEENKLDAAEKGKEEQIKVLSKVKGSISGIKDEDATKQIGEEIEIEKELEEHEKEIEEASSNLKIKIEVKGALNEQQKALIESLLISLKNKTAEVKVEIQNKKGKTKIEIKQKTGKSEKEIEAEIEDIEEEKGLAGIKREKAAEEIEDAKEGLAELEKELEEHKAEGHVADEKPITSLTDNAGKRITNAEEAFRQNDFGNAFGQANAAQQLIKNAERILEKTVEKFEEGEGEGEAEEKAEIEVEIEDGKAKIKIEVGDAKSRFTLDTTDKNAIIQEIAERTGLSVDEVTELAEFEEETEDEEEVEVEEKGKKEEKDEDDDWIKDLIAKEERQSVANPPASLTKCKYKNQIVYYLPPRCCDVFSVLYDEGGDVICTPDGGITGRGDRRCPDFFKERKDCEVIWKDSRSYPPKKEKVET